MGWIGKILEIDGPIFVVGFEKWAILNIFQTILVNMAQRHITIFYSWNYHTPKVLSESNAHW